MSWRNPAGPLDDGFGAPEVVGQWEGTPAYRGLGAQSADCVLMCENRQANGIPTFRLLNEANPLKLLAEKLVE